MLLGTLARRHKLPRLQLFPICSPTAQAQLPNRSAPEPLPLRCSSEVRTGGGLGNASRVPLRWRGTWVLTPAPPSTPRPLLSGEGGWGEEPAGDHGLWENTANLAWSQLTDAREGGDGSNKAGYGKILLRAPQASCLLYDNIIHSHTTRAHTCRHTDAHTQSQTHRHMQMLT